MTTRQTNTILDKIVQKKRLRLQEVQVKLPFDELMHQLSESKRLRPPRSFARALSTPTSGDIAVIAEFKRASPSRGVINNQTTPESMARLYEAGGAEAISVLTEEAFFGGSLADLVTIRKNSNLPLLCKDFILDRYQIAEAALAGADAILLIAALLEQEQLEELSTFAKSLALDVLLEVHTQTELDVALKMDFPLIGVNARDLSTFESSLDVVEILAKQVPVDRLVVAESAIHTRADVERVKRSGARAVLVGASLMTAEDPKALLQSLKGMPTDHHNQRVVSEEDTAPARRPASPELQRGEQARCRVPTNTLVKICGIRDVETAAVAISAGADYLGFIVNFPDSPRSLDADELTSLTWIIRKLPGAEQVKLVGVFVDQPIERVLDIARQATLDVLQFHGEEPPERCQIIREHSYEVWKAFRLQMETDVSQCAKFVDVVDGLLFDRFLEGSPGGTGQVFDWNWVNAADPIRKGMACHASCIILSGGLTPDNVQDAISLCSPNVVDVSSGVESGPGIKDHELIKRFIKNVKTPA